MGSISSLRLLLLSLLEIWSLLVSTELVLVLEVRVLSSLLSSRISTLSLVSLSLTLLSSESLSKLGVLLRKWLLVLRSSLSSLILELWVTSKLLLWLLNRYSGLLVWESVRDELWSRGRVSHIRRHELLNLGLLENWLLHKRNRGKSRRKLERGHKTHTRGSHS